MIRSPKALWRCPGIFFSQDSWTYTAHLTSSTYAFCWECCWIRGLWTWHINFLFSIKYSLLIFCTVFFVADIWYTWENDWDIIKNWFCYPGIYFEPNTIWRAIFQATILLPGKCCLTYNYYYCHYSYLFHIRINKVMELRMGYELDKYFPLKIRVVIKNQVSFKVVCGSSCNSN